MKIRALPIAMSLAVLALVGACSSTPTTTPTVAASPGVAESSAPPSVSVSAAPPVTVTAQPPPAPVTVTQPAPVTVTQPAPVYVQPPDPVTVYQNSSTGIYGLQQGLYCRDLKAMGYSYSQAWAYWDYWGEPANMDIDLNGIPCQTVY